MPGALCSGFARWEIAAAQARSIGENCRTSGLLDAKCCKRSKAHGGMGIERVKLPGTPARGNEQPKPMAADLNPDIRKLNVSTSGSSRARRSGERKCAWRVGSMTVGAPRGRPYRVWSHDVMAGRMSVGKLLRLPTVFEEHSRNRLPICATWTTISDDVPPAPTGVIVSERVPAHIRADNGAKAKQNQQKNRNRNQGMYREQPAPRKRSEPHPRMICVSPGEMPDHGHAFSGREVNIGIAHPRYDCQIASVERAETGFVAGLAPDSITRPQQRHRASRPAQQLLRARIILKQNAFHIQEHK